MDVGGQGKAARGNRRGGVLRSGHEHVATEAARLDVARALADALDADDALAEAFGDDVSLVAGVLDGVQEGDLADGLRVAMTLPVSLMSRTTTMTELLTV